MFPCPPSDVQTPAQAIPKRVLVLSGIALLIPLISLFIRPDWVEGEGALLVWLPSLLPAFLLAFFNGWRGAAQALAASMAVLALAQAELSVLDIPPPRWSLMLSLVSLMVLVALGAGWMSDGLHRARNEADKRALTDSLTGLANRRFANEVLARECAAAQRGRPVTVALFDLDRFKEMNDAQGHAVGDEVLIAFAHILRARTRASNLSARVGGEEFLTILSDTDADGGVLFAEAMRRAWADTDLGYGRMTMSAGVATVDRMTSSPDSLVAAADRALYAAKAQGRNRVCRAEQAPAPLVMDGDDKSAVGER